MRDGEDASVVDGQTGLPNREGWEAVLEAEAVRSRRHGGLHGLVLVELEVGAGGDAPERAALAIMQAVREIDLVARVDQQTFGVLALHCDDLERVEERLRARLERARISIVRLIKAHAGGAGLQTTWMSLIAGLPVSRSARHHLPFVAFPRVSLN